MKNIITILIIFFPFIMTGQNTTPANGVPEIGKMIPAILQFSDTTSFPVNGGGEQNRSPLNGEIISSGLLTMNGFYILTYQNKNGLLHWYYFDVNKKPLDITRFYVWQVADRKK
jgi:hypothetical protein